MKDGALRVDILLPAYNGELYIEQQVESIMMQTYSNIRLLVRDDDSTDSTREILRQLKDKYNEKIELITNTHGNLGVTESIIELMKHSDAQYIMLADQDDVWYSDKVKYLAGKITAYEARQNLKIPILVASDSRLVDKNGDALADSFVRYMGIDTNRMFFSNMIQRSIVQGASCIFNRELLELMLKNKPEVKVHDQWLAILAAAFGKVYYCRKPLMDYRQHDKNVIGAQKKTGLLKWWTGTEGDRKAICYRHYLYLDRSLCKKLRYMWRESLSAKDRKMLDYYISDGYNMNNYVQLGLWREYGLLDNIWRFLIGVL